MVYIESDGPLSTTSTYLVRVSLSLVASCSRSLTHFRELEEVDLGEEEGEEQIQEQEERLQEQKSAHARSPLPVLPTFFPSRITVQGSKRHRIPDPHFPPSPSVSHCCSVFPDPHLFQCGSGSSFLFNVADPGCLIIPDPNFFHPSFHPGSRIKEIKYFNPKIVSKLLEI